MRNACRTQHLPESEKSHQHVQITKNFDKISTLLIKKLVMCQSRQLPNPVTHADISPAELKLIFELDYYLDIPAEVTNKF